MKLILPMPTERMHGDMQGRWQLIDTEFDRDDPRHWWLSTVYLAIDHGGYIYETLVKIGAHDDVVDRYTTRIEATYGHWFYLRMCRYIVERNLFPTENDDGDRDFVSTYDQIHNVREFWPHAKFPDELYRSRTLCCDAPVTHEFLGPSRHYSSFLTTPPPRCRACTEVITQVRFESISRTEDV